MKVGLSGFLQSEFNVYLCRKMGWQLAEIYVQLLGSLYFIFRKREKHVILDNLGAIFASERGRWVHRRLCRSVMTGIFTHYYEKLFNAYCTDEESRRFLGSRVVDEGLFAVREGLSAGRGVLLVTGHYGGVEFIPGFLGANRIPVSIVVRFASDRLRSLSRSKGKRFHIRIIDVDRTPNLFFAICRHLAENRVVITQCDEIDQWRAPEKARISFLGRWTAPDRALNLLVHRTRCRVVFGVMHRNPGLTYRFITRPAPARGVVNPPSAGDAGLKFIEQFIYRYPNQWYQWAKLPMIERCAGPETASRLSAPVSHLATPIQGVS